MFLRNWIRSGVNRIGDLKFIDGKLDTHYMYRKIRLKTNILSEMLICREALLPYQENLRAIQNLISQEEHHCKVTKSKPFYVRFKKQVINNDDSLTNFLAPYCIRSMAICAFTKKVVLEKEIKLKEFNYKLLHGILPCNANLKKWRIKVNEGCDVCGLPQTIEHLLFSCGYVKHFGK